MVKKIDPTLIKSNGDEDFNFSLGLKLARYFSSREEAAACVEGLKDVDFRVVASESHPGMAELFVRENEWKGSKLDFEDSMQKAAFKEYWRWFPMIFLGMPVIGTLFGLLVMWYSFSGQLSHNGGLLNNPSIAFWITFGICVIAGWGKLAWNGIRIKLGDYSSD